MNCCLQSAWTTITVSVTDVNDNRPEIVQREITVNAERVQGAQITVVEVLPSNEKKMHKKNSYEMKWKNKSYEVVTE